MIDESSLPVGSCVKIANNIKTIMIAGYCFYDNQNKKMYDYIGIYVPIGIRKSRQQLVMNKDYICFNSGDINKVTFMGFSDKMTDNYLKGLKEMKKVIDPINSSRSDVENFLWDFLKKIKSEDK